MSSSSKLPAEGSGVYRAPDDPSRLRNRAAASGAVWLEADIGGVRDKRALLHALAEALSFPAGFGANWDALADNLQDLAWYGAAGYVLHLRDAKAARAALGEEWNTLLQVLRHTAAYWKGRHKPFVAIVDGAEELPEWL